MIVYQNYHRHSHWSNVKISDSPVKQEDYAKKAVELGQTLLSTVEHGWCGNVWDSYKLAKKYGLKLVIGAEAYFVRNRFEKDRTNAHIVLLARNENGRQSLNDVLSEANLTGFYHQPRLDVELLLSLPKDDVIVTTACIGYWDSYEDIDEITKQLASHFTHFYLECQYHNTESQRTINQHILDIRKMLNLPIIFGTDSHYIHTTQTEVRTDFLNSKGLNYPSEDGWYMDYPDGEEVYTRFASQCVLSHSDILEAIQNTNSIMDLIEEYNSPIFNDDIKMPSLYREWSQEKRDEEFKRLVYSAWDSYKIMIPEEKWEHYEKEIAQEVQTVVDTKTADYFIIDYYIIKKGKENGGNLTKSGRGSAPSFFINMLLGFTDIDRIASPVHLYPERFMTTERILSSKSLPDIDMNCADVAPFAKAQQDILGELHAQPMVAYGTYKKSSAWKLYAKSQGLEFSLANAVSDQIKKYENAVKHAAEDDRDLINVKEYITKEYWDIYEKSSDYLGLVTSWSIAPCGYILYAGDIRREFGLSRIKDNIVANIDGTWAEEGHFLKNDLLTVKSIDTIFKAYAHLGQEPPPIRQLTAECTPEDPCWDIYKKGATLFINQCEQPGTSQRVQKYAPKNISELAAFIAAIRPGFKSQYKKFEARENFEFGAKALDDLIKTEEFPQSFVLYQEQVMNALSFAGIPMGECYTAIKHISKKRTDKVYAIKEKFTNGFIDSIKKEGKPENVAISITQQVWQLIEDGANYFFNASHAVAMAYDSLYGAWLKAHYPLEFYETCLTICEEKGDKDRINALKDEAESYFNIKFPPFKFGQDNRSMKIHHESNSITMSLTSIKGFNAKIGNILFEVSAIEFLSFHDLLVHLYLMGIRDAVFLSLIKIGYFDQFGNIANLLAIFDAWKLLKRGTANSIKKDAILDDDFKQLISENCSDTNKDGSISSSYKTSEKGIWLVDEYEKKLMLNPKEDVSIREKTNWSLEILGYIDVVTNREEDRRRLFITDCVPLKDAKGTLWAYRVGTRSLGSGKTARVTVRNTTYREKPIKAGDIVYADYVWKNPQGYWYLQDYKIEM